MNKINYLFFIITVTSLSNIHSMSLLNKISAHLISEPYHYLQDQAALGKDRNVDWFLSTRRDIDVNHRSNGHALPLETAAKHGHDRVVLTLLKYKADPTCTDNLKRTPLMRAAWSGYDKVIQIFIKWTRKHNINLVDQADYQGETALIKTAYRRTKRAAQALLHAGAWVDHQDNLGNTTLMNALKYYRPPQHPWERDTRESFITYLVCLLSYGADYQTLTNNDGETAQAIAQKNGLETFLNNAIQQIKKRKRRKNINDMPKKRKK